MKRTEQAETGTVPLAQQIRRQMAVFTFLPLALLTVTIALAMILSSFYRCIVFKQQMNSPDPLLLGQFEAAEQKLLLLALTFLLFCTALCVVLMKRKLRLFAEQLVEPLHQLEQWTTMLGLDPEPGAGISQSRISEVRNLGENFRHLAFELHERNQQLNATHLDQSLLQQQARHYQQLALTDPLTKLANRQALQDELSRIQRAVAGPLTTLIMMDVDHFKLINDNFGHQTGDAVLMQVAACLQKQTRAHELLGRWGGEEFLLICTTCSTEVDHDLAERLRAAVELQPWSILDKVTLSVGVARQHPGEDINQTLERADRLLYHSKQLGRNRVSLEH